MITITFDRKQNSIRMTGHAGYNKSGKDIVCAGASMLFYALAETVTGFEHGCKKKPRVRVKDKDGDIEAFVSCRPKPEYEANLQIVYMTILNGFRLLAEGYPKNVELKII